MPFNADHQKLKFPNVQYAYLRTMKLCSSVFSLVIILTLYEFPSSIDLCNHSYVSKTSNTFLLLFSNKVLIIMAGIHNLFFRIANREDPDQTASSEAV